MNVKITKEQHNELCSLEYKEYIFGSQLHDIATNDSDEDFIRVISDDFYDKFKTKAKFLPNIHSWQFDDKENDIQYVWMTESQFYHNLFSGDGNMIADVVLLSGEFEDCMFLCRTYKVIKGYLGVAKRDLKMHGNEPKKRFHAFRSLYMAKELIADRLPTIEGIKKLKQLELPNKDVLFEEESELRKSLNDMLNTGSIHTYPIFKEENSLVQVMTDCNNIRGSSFTFR